MLYNTLMNLHLKNTTLLKFYNVNLFFSKSPLIIDHSEKPVDRWSFDSSVQYLENFDFSILTFLL